MSILLQLFGGGICLLLGLVQAITYKSPKKVPLWIHWLTFMGGVLVLIGAGLSNIESEKFQKELGNNTNILVGDKQGCYILFYGEPSSRNNNVYFQSKLFKIGNLPVYDINILLLDLSKTITKGKVNQSISDGRFINNEFNSQNLDIGNLSGGYKELPLIVTSSEQDFYHFIILISTRNGSFLQKQYFKYVNNKWETSCIVYNYKTNELLEKNVSCNFPKDLLDLKEK